MYLVYSMAFTASFMAMLPYFLYKAIRHGKYAASLKQRLGRVPSTPGQERPIIWVHAVSVGEFLAAEPLIQRMKEELPGYSVVVSTTTIAGQTLARDRTMKWARLCDDHVRTEMPSQSGAEAHRSSVFYFPLDWRFAVKRTLDRIHPVAVVIMETEIWPIFLDECRRRSIATIIANGRLSERSFSRYRLIKGFISQVLNSVAMMLMQTEADRERVVSLGANPDRVTICGNLKYDAVGLLAPVAASPRLGLGTELPESHESPSVELDRMLGLSQPPRVIVAGSTARGEEEIVLAAFRILIANPALADTRLILAPRTPERFDDVARIIADSRAVLEGEWVRRSELGLTAAGTSPAKDPSSARIVLLDSIGELGGIYRFASVVFVGGSLVPQGGHNIIEPAAFAKPILVGPYTHNFMQVVKDFVDAGALVRIVETDCGAQAEALATEWIRLLIDTNAAEALGARALKILELNRGATARTLASIKLAIGQGLA
jgi:3-deoxy-D-manno-octulosonic-acid transferase